MPPPPVPPLKATPKLDPITNPRPADPEVLALAPAPPSDYWSRAVPQQTTWSNWSSGRTRWNWAAGSIVGLALLTLLTAVPRFAIAVDDSLLDHQHLGDWLLYGAALGSLILLVCLAARSAAVVALLGFAVAGTAVASVIVIQDRWDMSRHATWSSLALALTFGVLGLLALGIRRVDV